MLCIKRGEDAQRDDALHPRLGQAATHDTASGERLQTTRGTETVSSNGCVGGVTGLAEMFQLC